MNELSYCNTFSIEDELIDDLDYLSSQLHIDKNSLKEKNNWYKIMGKWYYFKEIDSINLLINEILGSRISKVFDLDTIDYKIGIRNGKYGLLSENYRKDDSYYVYPEEMGINYNNTRNNNFSIVKDNCFDLDNYFMVKNKIFRQFVSDFYMAQSDRGSSNLPFLIDSDSCLDLAPIIDFEASFGSAKPVYINCIMAIDLDRKEDAIFVRNDLYMQEQFYKLMDFNMSNELRDISDEFDISIQNDTKKYYSDFDRSSKILFKKYHIIK